MNSEMYALDKDLAYRFGYPYCPHKQEWLESGFGLAGGGYGVYTYCSNCHRILDKVQTD